jgi:hypothetical protein
MLATTGTTNDALSNIYVAAMSSPARRSYSHNMPTPEAATTRFRARATLLGDTDLDGKENVTGGRSNRRWVECRNGIRRVCVQIRQDPAKRPADAVG